MSDRENVPWPTTDAAATASPVGVALVSARSSQSEAFVTYLSERTFPGMGADLEQVVRTVSSLAEIGAQVELVVPRGVRDWRGDEALALRLSRHYGVPTLPVRALPALPRPPTRSESSRVDRALQYAVAMSYLPFAFAYLLARRPSLVHVRTPAALVTALAAGRPVLYETYRPDLPLPTRKLLERARAVVTHSSAAEQALVASGFPAHRVHVLRNGWDPSLMGSGLPIPAARQRARIAGGAPLALYAGRCGPDKGVDSLLDLAARVPEVRFLILGADPVHRARLERCVRRARMGNVEIRLAVPPVEVPIYLYAADVLLIPAPTAPTPGARVRTLLPIKTFAYMASGRAILAPALPDLEEVLENQRTAILYRDLAGAAAGLRELLASPALRARLGEAAQRQARWHTLRARALRLRDLYESIL